jgi:HTH-type transcriptional regulator/antitoxin HigA
MTLRPIKSEADYTAALQEIERLWDAEPGTPESDTFENLVTLVEAYEKGRYDLPPPDPKAALEYFMESRRPAVPPEDRCRR